jgi:hypothetical protein
MSREEPIKGWDVIPERQERIEREAAREYAVRERFRLRAERERRNVPALERNMQQAFEEKQRAARKAVDENATLSQMRAVLGDVVHMRGQLAVAAEDQREVLAEAEASMRVARSPEGQRRRPTNLTQVAEHIQKAQADLKRFEEAHQMAITGIRDCEAAARELRVRISEAVRTVKEQEAILKRTQRRLAQKETLIGEAEEIATMEWPAQRKAREVLYLKDLSLFLKETLPSDKVVISPPSEPDDRKPQTAKRPFISVRLCDAPAAGSFYIQCNPRRFYGHFVLHSTVADSVNPKEHEIELSMPLMTVREVADALQTYINRPRSWL